MAPMPKTKTPPTQAHEITIRHEGPSRNGALVRMGGHRASCSCGWGSDCYSQLSDTERAIDVHLRRADRLDFEGLLARSSIGAAVADVKARGIDAHLVDLESDLDRRRPRKKSAKAPLTAEDAAFTRGFGVALASIWRCHHDGQMVRCLLKQNGFTLASFRGLDMLDGDYEAICAAVRQ